MARVERDSRAAPPADSHPVGIVRGRSVSPPSSRAPVEASGMDTVQNPPWVAKGRVGPRPLSPVKQARQTGSWGPQDPSMVIERRHFLDLSSESSSADEPSAVVSGAVSGGFESHESDSGGDGDVQEEPVVAWTSARSSGDASTSGRPGEVGRRGQGESRSGLMGRSFYASSGVRGRGEAPDSQRERTRAPFEVTQRRETVSMEVQTDSFVEEEDPPALAFRARIAHQPSDSSRDRDEGARPPRSETWFREEFPSQSRNLPGPARDGGRVQLQAPRLPEFLQVGETKIDLRGLDPGMDTYDEAAADAIISRVRREFESQLRDLDPVRYDASLSTSLEAMRSLEERSAEVSAAFHSKVEGLFDDYGPGRDLDPDAILARWRERQDARARAAGMTPDAYADHINARAQANPATLKKIEAFYDVNILGEQLNDQEPHGETSEGAWRSPRREVQGADAAGHHGERSQRAGEPHATGGPVPLPEGMDEHEACMGWKEWIAYVLDETSGDLVDFDLTRVTKRIAYRVASGLRTAGDEDAVKLLGINLEDIENRIRRGGEAERQALLKQIEESRARFLRDLGYVSSSPATDGGPLDLHKAKVDFPSFEEFRSSLLRLSGSEAIEALDAEFDGILHKIEEKVSASLNLSSSYSRRPPLHASPAGTDQGSEGSSTQEEEGDEEGDPLPDDVLEGEGTSKDAAFMQRLDSIESMLKDLLGGKVAPLPHQDARPKPNAAGEHVAGSPPGKLPSPIRVSKPISPGRPHAPPGLPLSPRAAKPSPSSPAAKVSPSARRRIALGEGNGADLDSAASASPRSSTPRSMSPLVGGLIHETLENALLAVEGEDMQLDERAHRNTDGNWVLDVPHAAHDAAVSSWIGVLGERAEDLDQGEKISESRRGGVEGSHGAHAVAPPGGLPAAAEAQLTSRGRGPRSHADDDDQEEDEVVRMLREKIFSCNAQLHAFFHTL